MSHVRIPVPDDLAESWQMSAEEFNREARLLFAVKAFELGRITAGTAAEIAGMDRLPFLDILARYRVPAINLQEDEAAAEIRTAAMFSEARAPG